MIKKIYNTIKQWSVVRWCKTSIAWCFRWLCFIMQWLWERCIFNNFLICLIFVGGGIMLAVAGILLLEAFAIWWMDLDLGGLYDLLQALIWSIGGVGAAIGLWFADQRQKTLSEQTQAQVEQAQAQVKQAQAQANQVKVQINQGFNDRLGRGVELLANENMVMCSAGLQTLRDLADNADNEQRLIIAKIIHNFFRDKAKIKRDKKKKPRPRTLEQTSSTLQDALDFLINLPQSTQQKLRDMQRSEIAFDSLDFSHLTLNCEILNRVNFLGSYFVEAKFRIRRIIDADFSNSYFKDVPFDVGEIMHTSFDSAEFDKCIFFGKRIMDVCFDSAVINSTNFEDMKMTQAKFSGKNLSNIEFKNVGLEGGEFRNVSLYASKFQGVSLHSVKFHQVEFFRGHFECKNKIKISSKDDLPRFTSTDLGLTKFDFDDEIEPNDFFKLCYYGAKQKSTRMDASRRYYLREGWGNVFVESDKRWSGKPLNGWVKLERAAIETEKRDVEEYRMRMAEEAAENIPEQDYQQSPPHPIEEADQFLKREMESLKRFGERERKKNANPKPKARASKPKAKKPKPKKP